MEKTNYAVIGTEDIRDLVLEENGKPEVIKGCDEFKYFGTKITNDEMDFLRRSARCSKLDRVRNEDIRKKLEYQNFIVDYIHNKQLPGYGHVRRMEEGRPAKQILEWIPAGRKRRGRPGTTWIEEIQKALDHRRLTEEECRDRIEWRRKVWAREDA
ncbi:uncharacterized protein LOC111616736 [Centruroides sculpturatus]|uniref:uncharacterized protein LOC111616736 n=1 Tax=Centruroides sculpturatus TaxID=218467 RepID=UPI000C6CB0D4|nr:uncharacterized protein LOC111616736 [Centruroides sculpturatus]